MSEVKPRPLFYEEDLVELVGDAGQRVATVVRTWHADDEEWDGDDDDDDEDEVDLAENEYLIEWITGRRQTVDSVDLILKDRSFQVGDICRSTTQTTSDLVSGVVTDVRMKVALQSTVTAPRQPDWMTTTSLSHSACIEEGDHVIYRNWVGIVEMVFEEALVTVRGSNRPYKVFCVEGGLRYGSPSDSLLDTMQGSVTGKSLGSHIIPRNSRVVAIRHTAVFISWLAINQKLSSQDEYLFPEPKSVWTDLEELTVIRPFEDHKYALGDTIFIVDAANGSDQGIKALDEDKVLQVCSTKSQVEVLWQDGTRTWQDSTSLEQPTAIESHFVWPGDHIVYRDANAKETGAVVQSMEPSEQIVCILVYEEKDAVTKTVSVLDCKLEGSPDYLYAISRGDVVLISSKGTGYSPPSVARLGKVAQDDIDEEEQEEKLIAEGRAVAKTATRAQLSTQKRPRLAKEAHDIDWYGVVIDCATNGRIIIELPDGKRIEESVDRLSILVDGFEDDDAASSNGSSWGSTDDEGEVNHTRSHSWTSKGVQDEEWQDDVETEEVEDNQSPDPQSATGSTYFNTLENAPSDHAFLSQSHVGSQQKSFLSRVQREHRILSSSLPDTILVRSYEDRMDLFRAIVVGSQGTPYEDAPICIDLHLQSSYPSTPPLAFFHSWSRGLGRINPHLYEDGSVCLSLLNTWQGDKTEAWNPGKSTLLQVLVSIQGLVLVAEPGLETEHIQVNQQSSLLYSERAYILSRHFIVHALKVGVKGFEEDLQLLYGARGRLSSSIQKACHRLDQDSTITDVDGGLHLTKGGTIALRPIVTDMERLPLYRQQETKRS